MTSPGGLTSTVAVKLLLPELDPRSQAVERLRDEARVLAALRHGAILTVHDLVVLEGRVGLVAEYIEGADLDHAFGADDPLGPREVVQVIERVADALDAAWRARGPDGRPLGLVHRDIKPANIRLSTRGGVKVLDFGLAKAGMDGLEAKTQTDMILGTVSYMAPERFLIDGHENGPAGDVFALGCVLYEGLARRPLFDGRTVHQVMALAYAAEAHTAWIAERIAALDAPPALRDALSRMLAHDPAARPTAAEVLEWAEETAPTLPGVGLRRWCRAHPFPPPDGQDAALVGRELSERSFGVRTQEARSTTPSPTPSSADAPDADPGVRTQEARSTGPSPAPPSPQPPTPSPGPGATPPQTEWVPAPPADAAPGAGTAPPADASPTSLPASRETAQARHEAPSTPTEPQDPASSPPRQGAGTGLLVAGAAAAILLLGLGALALVGTAGAAAWTLAPPADPDEDGILADADACPDAPETLNGFQDDDGCPDDADTDADGIALPDDACPDAPETLNDFEDDDGCPDTPPPPEQLTSTVPDLTLLRIPGGTFTMGCTAAFADICSRHERPAHEVTVSPFYLARTELTQAQWRDVMGADPPKLYFGGCDDCPVDNVSWVDAGRYANALSEREGLTPCFQGDAWTTDCTGYRLPTEAEWEFAARAGTDLLHAGSDDPDEVGWFRWNYGTRTRRVAQKAPNGFGLYDMSGNVDEICTDIWGPYPEGPVTDPTGPENGGYIVARGGSISNEGTSRRLTMRVQTRWDVGSFDNGVRLARSGDGVE